MSTRWAHATLEVVEQVGDLEVGDLEVEVLEVGEGEADRAVESRTAIVHCGGGRLPGAPFFVLS